jgi:O-antigen/teichoic acid export membrane protein
VTAERVQPDAIGHAETLSLQREGRALSGATLLSGAMLVSGALAYAFQVLAAHSLSADQFGRIAVLWAGMFLVATILFRPLEQTLTRSLVDRRLRGQGLRPVVRSTVRIALATIAGAILAGALFYQWISAHLFAGDGRLTLLLIFGISVFSLVHLGRGVLCGLGYLGSYAATLAGDGIARLIIVAPLFFVASEGLAAVAVVTSGVIGVIPPVWRRRRTIGAAMTPQAASPFSVKQAFAFAAPASIMAGVDQMLVNGGPLLVAVDGGAKATAAAGLVFAATMLVRAPAYVFQGVAATLLRNLTQLHTGGRSDRFRGAVLRVAGLMLAAGGVMAILAALAGPQMMRAVFGPTFTATPGQLALLAAGVGFYLAASTISQALLATGSSGPACIGWIAGLAVFLAAFLATDGDPLSRIAVAFSAATLTNMAVSGAVLVVRTRGTWLGEAPARADAMAPTTST